MDFWYDVLPAVPPYNLGDAGALRDQVNSGVGKTLQSDTPTYAAARPRCWLSFC